MHRALVLLAVAACSSNGAITPDGNGGGGGGDASGSGNGDAARADAPAGAAASILYQCTPFGGGLCVMAADGSAPMTLDAAGFAPRGLGDGAILFHTASYRVARRAPGGTVVELGDGAFPRPASSGRIVFQCSGLGGGICSMAADGSDRSTIRASGRVPDVDGAGTLLFHSDGYRVIRRTAAGQELDLGPGAFAVWMDDGRILFQCSGLDGGLCRMAADGSARVTIHPSGRVPDVRPDGDIVFHADDYTVWSGAPGGVAARRAGANAVWW